MPILTVQYPNPRPSKLETKVMILCLGTIAALMISVSMTRTTKNHQQQIPRDKTKIQKNAGLKGLLTVP